ncbi:MAG: methyltransferase domain-containing protein [Nitrososphaeria archaeon]|nr:methyltransferase domain-containing protein [Nitrososphaeria archaeon]
MRERSKKILGPLRDLEEYVPTDWWKHIFNSLYLKTDGDVVNDQNITKKEVDLFIKILDLKTEDSILDLCCGHGRHSLELARRGFKNVEGLDISHYLIRKARAQAEKEGLKVRFREGDARKLPYPPDTFNVVMILGNSFGYFESIKEDLQVLKEVKRVLTPWGKILIDVADGRYLKEEYQKRSWEWISKHLFVCRERSLSSDNQRLITREVIVNVKKGVVADQIYAVRLYDKETLKQLLEKAGFTNIVFHGELSPESKRNQDLGMMEKRIIVTAVAKKEWTPIRKKMNGAKMRVAVILGDPSKYDSTKPGGVFDEDDIYTINKLIQALNELREYEFIYIMNHDTLLQDLIKIRSKIDLVFNLCDEGFYNDPRKELHIPALLDVLGIPYTGAGPRCLAYCYDKSLVRGIAKEMDIPVSRAVFLKTDDITIQLPFDFPAIVKPNYGDSSFGITSRNVVYNEEQLLNAISELRSKFNYNGPIVIEEFLTGKDLTLGIIGNPPEDYTVLPITEEDYSVLPEGLPQICGYEAKWLPDTPYWNIKSVLANIPQEVREYIIESSVKLFIRLECRDYARFDWRLDAEGNPRLLEVNPNPGWCWDGHLAKMAAYAGMSYPEMLRAILKAAEKRLGIQKPEIKKVEPTISRSSLETSTQ